jgi:hypothetical protein
MSIFKGIDVIRRWVIQTVLKDRGKQGGVTITLPRNDFVDLNTRITAERLMRNGIDPNSITSVNQVENIINQLNKPRVVAADSPEGKGITEALLGKKGEVFNLQGEKLDPNKPIIGGTQQGKKINREFFERDAEGKDDIRKGIAKEVQQRIDSGVATTIEKMLAMEPIDAMKEANLVIGRKGPYKNLTQEDAKKILQDTEDHIFERNVDIDPEDMFADGGRIGFKKGMTRRRFLEIMGGVGAAGAAAKTGLLKLMGKEKAAPVVEKAAEVLGGGTPPPYFFNLVDRIRALGKKFDGPKERTESYKYKDYEMQIDKDTGQIEIEKKQYDIFDDQEGLVSEEYMSFKPGQADETTGGKKVVDEYDEYTARADQDGKMKDVESGVSEETVMDGSISKEELEQEIVEQLSKEKIKKAEGGRIPFVFGGGVMKVILQNLAKEKGISPSEYLSITNYRLLPDSVKRIMSKSEYLKLKEEMTGKRIEMVENIRDMIESRQAFDKSKDDLRKSMNMASEGYGDEAVKMMFPEGSFKSPVPAGTTKDDVMMMEQLIKNLQTKGRKENASGGLAGMLGE